MAHAFPSDVNLDNINKLTSRVVRGSKLHPSNRLIIISAEVLPAYGPLVYDGNGQHDGEEPEIIKFNGLGKLTVSLELEVSRSHTRLELGVVDVFGAEHLSLAVEPDADCVLAEVENHGRDIAACLEPEIGRLLDLGRFAIGVREWQFPDQRADFVVVDLVVAREVEVVRGVVDGTRGRTCAVAEPFDGSARVAARAVT